MRLALLTPAQVAEAAQLSEATVLRLMRNGQLPGAKKIGGSWRVVEPRFMEWLESDDTMPESPQGDAQATATEYKGWR